MDTESVAVKVSEPSSVLQKTTSSGSLATVFKYVGIGMGIIGIGFLIAILGYLFLR
jgi:hypothetical protein